MTEDSARRDFNLIFKNNGGVFNQSMIDIESLNRLNIFKTHIQKIISYIRKHYPTLPNIYVDYINNMTLNAGAAFYKGNYYVGINIGAKMLIGDLFHAELSSPNV